MFNLGRLIVVLIILPMVFGCGTDNPAPTTGEQYFPLRTGDYRIYSVNETRIEPYNVEGVFTYEIKTLVTDSFLNSTGTYSYIISRFKRTAPSVNWQSLDTWTAKCNEREVVISEGNIPFVKILSPVQANLEWNGNAYNNEKSSEFCGGNNFTSCDIYSFGEINKTFASNYGLTFDNTVEVIENNNPDLFTTHDVRKEVYAWQVGLVFREITLLKYCTIGSCYGKQMVENGLVYTQELTEYGRQ